jgi:serine/threonine-protein kinase
MSVEPGEFTSELWTRWQGHLINGVFPLGRYLGGSDRSGVFLTRSAALASDVAIKLVAADRALAEALLPRWKRSARLTHPHLLRLLEWGGCQLSGLPYLYLVMEYADQTLEQLLRHRALTDTEAQEMLLPTLEALAFLHERELIQGQLKPANILVVGDQLKLASDTIRRWTEVPAGAHRAGLYEAPTAERGASSTADDIRALGITLCEALTRRPPSLSGALDQALTLPPELSPTLRALIGRCLRPSAQERPSARELLASARPDSAPAAAASSEAEVSQPPIVRAAAAVEAASDPARPAPSARAARRALIAVLLGAAVLIASVWLAGRLPKVHPAPVARPSPPQAARAPRPPMAPATPVAAQTSMAKPLPAPAPLAAAPTLAADAADAASPPAALHQVIPELSRGVRRAVRGHIKVWVRTTVAEDGSVLGAVLDRASHSRYFQRLALEAAKGWTFAPLSSPAVRLLQIQFDFSRSGATARVVALH